MGNEFVKQYLFYNYFAAGENAEAVHRKSPRVVQVVYEGAECDAEDEAYISGHPTVTSSGGSSSSSEEDDEPLRRRYKRQETPEERSLRIHRTMNRIRRFRHKPSKLSTCSHGECG